MNATFEKIIALVLKEEIKISIHGYEELANDNLWIDDLILTLKDGIVIEDYPSYHKGSCVLILQKDQNDLPVHAVWGLLSKGTTTPAVLITAYRPAPDRWSKDFKIRKKGKPDE